MKLKETLRGIIREEITKVLRENDSVNEAMMSEADVKATFKDVVTTLKSKGYTFFDRYLNKIEGGQRLWLKLRGVSVGDDKPISANALNALLDKTLPEGYNFFVGTNPPEIAIYAPNMKTGKAMAVAGTETYLKRRNP